MPTENKIPSHIIETINTLLAPYGKSYSPEQAETSKSLGYLSRKEAAKFLSMALVTLDRKLAAREIPFSKYGNSKSSKVTIAVSDLIAHAEAHRVTS